MHNYEVIILYEIKSYLPVSVPGYVSYISRDANNPHLGGTCVLIKQYLNCVVIELDVSIADQVWFKRECVPNVFFGFCYVPPPDSPYYSLALLRGAPVGYFLTSIFEASNITLCIQCVGKCVKYQAETFFPPNKKTASSGRDVNVPRCCGTASHVPRRVV